MNYDEWKKDFFGIEGDSGIKTTVENHFGYAHLLFVPAKRVAEKYYACFGEEFYFLNLQVSVYANRRWWNLDRKWIDRVSKAVWKDRFLEEGKTDVQEYHKYTAYQTMFARSKKTGRWYKVRRGDFGDYDIDMDIVPSELTYWKDNSDLPTVGTNDLEESYDFHRDAKAMYLSSARAVQQDMVEAKKKQEGRVILNQVREGLISHLARTLVESRFNEADGETREKLISHTINGDLELEGLDISSLDVLELIEEISNRIPEDQRSAFQERTKELLNAYIEP